MPRPQSAAASTVHAPLGFREFVILVAALQGLNAVSIDIMLPALGQIGRDLAVAGENSQQLVLTTYLAGFGVGQFFIGPASDRYGRRPVLLAGLFLYVVMAAVCAFAPSFELLLVARVLQGLASAVPRVVTISMIRDCYKGPQMARVMSLTMIVFMAVPVLAPSVGQAITLFGSWRLIFGFIAAFSGIVFVWACLRVPETLSESHRRPLSIATFASAVREVVSHRQCIGYLLAAGTMFGALFGFLNSAQQIYSEIFGVGKWFPLIFGAVALSIALSSFINSAIVQRFGMRPIVQAALMVFTALSLAMLLLEQLGLLSLVPFVALLGSAMFLVGMLFANMNALAMEPMGHIAGTASSVVGSLSTIIAAVCGYYIGSQFDHTLLPFCLGFVILGGLSLASSIWAEKGRIFILPR